MDGFFVEIFLIKVTSSFKVQLVALPSLPTTPFLSSGWESGNNTEYLCCHGNVCFLNFCQVPCSASCCTCVWFSGHKWKSVLSCEGDGKPPLRSVTLAPPAEWLLFLSQLLCLYPPLSLIQGRSLAACFFPRRLERTHLCHHPSLFPPSRFPAEQRVKTNCSFLFSYTYSPPAPCSTICRFPALRVETLLIFPVLPLTRSLSFSAPSIHYPLFIPPTPPFPMTSVLIQKPWRVMSHQYCYRTVTVIRKSLTA